jgi:hypothetical protein
MGNFYDDQSVGWNKAAVRLFAVRNDLRRWFYREIHGPSRKFLRAVPFVTPAGAITIAKRVVKSRGRQAFIHSATISTD